MAIADLRQQASDLLMRRGPGPEADEALAEGPDAGVEPLPFSAFVQEHLERARAITGRLMELADENPGEFGLQAALDAAEEAIAVDPGAGKHALMMFITHHPAGSQLPIPALEERQPEMISRAQTAFEEGVAEAVDPETRLDWFRTDPLANQHHEHWHVVYPHEGIETGRGAPPFLQDRQGEIFLYMHQQMLARYDTERLAAGLPKVRPLADYRAPIAEGYDPQLSGYVARPPGARLVDIVLDGQAIPLSFQEQSRTRLNKAVADDKFNDGRAVDVDALGAAAESTIGSVDRRHYGQLHNLGHVFSAMVTSPQGGPHGVMWDTATAIRDPIFYQWHRHVDDFGFNWQETQPSLAFDDAPPVQMRTADGASQDVAVCSVADIPGGDDEDFDWAAWGAATFGGDAWPTPASDVAPATGELHTLIATRTVAGGPVPHLDHEDFVYVVRAENQAAEPTDVTVRIFLVLESEAEDRRSWIEMDKFHHQLPASGRTVIVRPNRLSSVIQKKAVRPPQPRREPGPNAGVNYCNCGWPFHLLVPKGTNDGMRCRLLVMLTDWTVDQTAADAKCGSMSFCGARDARYPDTRPMGYPFVRPFANGVIDTLAGLASAGLRPIVVRHR